MKTLLHIGRNSWFVWFVLLIPAVVQAQPTLKEAFESSFLIGAALNRAQFFEEDTLGAVLVRTHFNTITPENVLKWERVHPESDRYDFEAPDRLVAFGEENGMAVIGHTLVWHSQTPRWVFEDAEGKPLQRQAMLDRMRDHIQTVMGRYKGRIKGWDVVNEAVNEDGTMRPSLWKLLIGEDFIAQAFRFAREADPNAELYYNDYNLENPEKRQGAVRMIKALLDQGVPIDGVGLQGHYHMEWPAIEEVDATIRAFTDLGLKVMITELDINVLPQGNLPNTADVAARAEMEARLNPYSGGLPDSLQQALARRYADLFEVFLKHRGDLTRVTFWGVADGDSWLNNWPIRGRTNYPLIFDRHHQSKPAFDAIIETVRRHRPNP